MACTYCGAPNSYGPSCVHSPNGLHVHLDDPNKCIYCGSIQYGKGCIFSPTGYHEHAPGGNKCAYCGSIQHGKGCPFSPNGTHLIAGGRQSSNTPASGDSSKSKTSGAVGCSKILVVGVALIVLIDTALNSLASTIEGNPTLEMGAVAVFIGIPIILLIILFRGRSKKKKSYENEIVHAGESIKKSALVVKPDDFTNWFCFLTFNQIILGRYFILKKEKEILHIPIKDIRVCTKGGQKILMLFQSDEGIKEMVLKFTKPTEWIQEIEQSGVIVIPYRDYKKERNSVLHS